MAHPLFRLVVALLLVSLITAPSPAQPGAQPAGLRIVVIEGEDAINILQQKTAVAPVVEVRDSNNLPVGGVTVTFSVTGGQATFAGGAQTLTVTTNAVGRAAAAALNPVQAGAVRIDVLASLQGQTATTTITQTNVATAAEAAARAAEQARLQGGQSSGGGSGTSAGGATAGGTTAGGGLSGAAIAGIVGGVAAGAAVGVKAASGGGDSGGSGGTNNNGGGGGGTGTTPPPCSFAVSPTTINTSSAAGFALVTVTTSPTGCQPSTFSTASNSSFLTINGGGGNTPSVNFVTNPEFVTRTGTVTIAGTTVTVNQGPRCAFQVSPLGFGNVPAGGGVVTVNVTVTTTSTPPCEPFTWTAFVNTLASATVSPDGGSRNGSVVVTFLPNPMASGSRPVSVTVAGQVLTGTQGPGTSAASAARGCTTKSVRGGDLAETRTFDLGRTSGRFVFTYDTGERSDDRVVVLYEGRTLFDTGCVSTGGQQMRALSYSGSSSAVTVQVAPNCRGGFGSAWSVEVACPQ